MICVCGAARLLDDQNGIENPSMTLNNDAHLRRTFKNDVHKQGDILKIYIYENWSPLIPSIGL